ncbi:MAG: phosphoribosylformylglycinamidine cyclo-ligase [Phycisphaerales bacterium]|nr:phosphoribosylformylglycinamidine cyclo-ligase [Phycisphaerales bacterium]
MRSLTYAASGVNLIEKDAFTESLGSIMRRTHGPRVIDNPGGFAGLFRLDFNQRLFARNYKDPVLVACTDGCGTKVKLASQVGRFDTIGIDCVAMNVNDMVVQGAEPLFFLDYIAVGRVDARMLRDIVSGVAEGCRLAGCALIGGETAEMPDVYDIGPPPDFDLAGFAVGVVELARATDPERVEKGDIVLGLTSSGVHSNGYSLVRKVVQTAGLDLMSDVGFRMADVKGESAGNGRRAKGKPPASHPTSAIRHPTLGEVLLTPTRIYADSITRLLRQYKVKKVVTGMAHITGSGMEGNLSRALHPGVDAVVDFDAWPRPPLFAFLQKQGRIDEDEMRRVFNCGIGYTLIVRPTFAEAVKEKLEKLGETVYVIGKIVKGKGDVRWK